MLSALWYISRAPALSCSCTRRSPKETYQSASGGFGFSANETGSLIAGLGFLVEVRLKVFEIDLAMLDSPTLAVNCLMGFGLAVWPRGDADWMPVERPADDDVQPAAAANSTADCMSER